MPASSTKADDLPVTDPIDDQYFSKPLTAGSATAADLPQPDSETLAYQTDSVTRAEDTTPVSSQKVQYSTNNILFVTLSATLLLMLLVRVVL